MSAYQTLTVWNVSEIGELRLYLLVGVLKRLHQIRRVEHLELAQRLLNAQANQQDSILGR